MSSETINIFCVKCRANKAIPKDDVKEGVMEWTVKKGEKKGTKGSRNAYHATCPTCGTQIKRFSKAPEKK